MKLTIGKVYIETGFVGQYNYRVNNRLAKKWAKKYGYNDVDYRDNRIPMIKDLRELHREKKGFPCGLRNAKEWLDKYFNFKDDSCER